MTIASFKAMLIGAGGSLILAVFCSTFLVLEKVAAVMPLFVAFNGAITGYRLVETVKTPRAGAGLFPFVVGAGTGALTFEAAHLGVLFLEKGFLLNSFDLLVYVVVSGCTGYLGARLAVRYFNL
ncbi:MAG: hypothetical protein R6V54_02525 [Desulfobacteraceae bacterium]